MLPCILRIFLKLDRPTFAKQQPERISIHSIRAGMVKINTMRGKAPGATSEPFNSSGLGHGYGVEFLHELTRQKSIHWKGLLS